MGGSVTLSLCNFVGEGIITYSWEGDRSDFYPEKNTVNQGEAEVDNVFFEG